MVSAIISAHLSGCPAEIDSDVKRYILASLSIFLLSFMIAKIR
jgi:hypothetical protein